MTYSCLKWIQKLDIFLYVLNSRKDCLSSETNLSKIMITEIKTSTAEFIVLRCFPPNCRGNAWYCQVIWRILIQDNLSLKCLIKFSFCCSHANSFLFSEFLWLLIVLLVKLFEERTYVRICCLYVESVTESNRKQ